MSAEESLITAARNRVNGARAVHEYIPATLITQLADALEAKIAEPDLSTVAAAFLRYVVEWKKEYEADKEKYGDYWIDRMPLCWSGAMQVYESLRPKFAPGTGR